ALEEAVVNSLYHRDWAIREPVEITVEPERISILSFSGPNHTIPMEAVRTGMSLRSRRYRNHRLGEFLKELDLTEGRATGIPTIQDELRENGLSQATIETDEERTYFLIDIRKGGCL
ncbi:MAG: transcriptional regulator, partial [Alloprevotella sp.]|nr:transcriptional regulator [Alloprevotella sp.]